MAAAGGAAGAEDLRRTAVSIIPMARLAAAGGAFGAADQGGAVVTIPPRLV